MENLKLYRRHELVCAYRGPDIKGCRCPIWVDGQERGRRVRRSLRTRSTSRAMDELIKIQRGLEAPLVSSVSIEKAIRSYLEDCRERKLADSTVARYGFLLEPLAAHYPGARLSSLTLDGLATFRADRSQIAPGSGRLGIIVLRTLLRFCVDRGWITNNPAAKLKAPRIDSPATMPFTREEVARMLSACNLLAGGRRTIERTRSRAKALILLLLYSGFRISDAVRLQRSAVDFESGRLLIRVMKTRVPLYSRLPEEVLSALKALPIESSCFLWSGNGKLICAINSAGKTIRAVAKLAGVADAHPHRFRDTFSVRLLENGTDIRIVQLLLGHASVVTTEKHYAPYVAGMQRIVDEAVSSLHFSSDLQPLVDSDRDALRNTNRNILTLARVKAR